MNIAVISTGEPSAVLRRTVSTREWEAYSQNAADIAAALAALGHAVVRLTDGPALVGALSHVRPDLAWVCSGGIQGRDPATHLPAVLEMLGLDYVGATPLAAGLADHKARAKALLRDAGVATPEFTAVPTSGVPETPAFGYPVMVKPVCGMCSCGVKKAHTLQELRHAVAVLQRRYPDQVLIERLVDGFDITVPVLEARGVPRCLPPLQRFFADRNDPACQHFLLPHPSSELREGRPIPAVLSHAQHRAACDVARAAFTVLGLRHCARIDLRLSGLTAWFLEANHKPDLTRNSLFAQSAALAGIEYEELIDRLLAGACHPGSIRSPALAARPRSRLRLR